MSVNTVYLTNKNEIIKIKNDISRIEKKIDNLQMLIIKKVIGRTAQHHVNRLLSLIPEKPIIKKDSTTYLEDEASSC
tara:strand:- start:1388 stop:1618 length:231 start_codon:yes stop_codon:yes gene_type:complete